MSWSVAVLIVFLAGEWLAGWKDLVKTLFILFLQRKVRIQICRRRVRSAESLCFQGIQLHRILSIDSLFCSLSSSCPKMATICDSISITFFNLSICKVLYYYCQVIILHYYHRWYIIRFKSTPRRGWASSNFLTQSPRQNACVVLTSTIMSSEKEIKESLLMRILLFVNDLHSFYLYTITCRF